MVATDRQEDIFLAHMGDLSARAARTGCAASKFLTPAEAGAVSAHFARRRDISLEFCGGFEEAERVRAVFLHANWGEYSPDSLVCALEIRFRAQDALTHRDILGALMALGVERETLGDIAVFEQNAYIVCLPEMAAHIERELCKIGRAGVKISRAALDSLPAREQKMEIKTDTVASLRLDAVLGAMFSLSRARSCELIDARRVSVDHQPCERADKTLDEGALVSVRGLGRAKLIEVGGKSKKGRIFIKIGLYSR